VPRNDDGEFELVLGNRQLLSVFFIVVILLGVFFTMGYIVGRNSAPLVAEVPKKAERPLTVDPTPESISAPSESARSAPPKETAQQLPPETSAEKADTKPPKEETAPEPKSVKVPKENQPKPEKGEHKVDAKAEPKSEKKESARAAASSEEPSAGKSYLQLAATSKREADVMVDVLRQKGFKALAAEMQEKPGTFRVLVGPVPDGGRNNVRAELQKSGFPGNIAIPRTF
jgi:outer membrane biosynthesis protein TonB